VTGQTGNEKMGKMQETHEIRTGKLESLYQERLRRYVTAMNNEQPDRVPIRLFAQEFAARYCGRSNFEVACDYDLAFDVTRRCATELNVDATMSNAIVNWWGMSNAIGWKRVHFPGIDIDPKSATQWTEPSTEDDANMKADEYDSLIDDPTGYLMNTWFPRFSDRILGPGERVTFEHNLALIGGAMSFLTYMGAFGKYASLLRSEAGLVSANAGTLKAPLDILGDKFRGYLNLANDLFERRDKVVAACEALAPHLLQSALAGADPRHEVPITIWMHRGGVPFVSPEIFQNVYWATLKPIVEEIWGRGHQVLFYAEGNWDYHLESFAELPERSIIFHVDRGDVLKAKQTLGRRFCISGGIGNDILSVGTPADVRQRCRQVLAEAAHDGGYIMDASALIMDDARTENVKAMIDYTLEHGVYSRSSSGRRNPIGPVQPASRVAVAEEPRSRSAGGGREPGVCIPWRQEREQLRALTGDEELVRRTWEKVDGLAYSFIWTNLTW
jgi:methoxylated aromatic compound---corrinoid protein Co-methyltransferase